MSRQRSLVIPELKFEWQHAAILSVCSFVIGFCIWSMVIAYAENRVSEELAKIPCVGERVLE